MSSSKVSLFFTGLSGYIGGTILTHLSQQPELRAQLKVHASVRKDDQRDFAESQGYHPVFLDTSDKVKIRDYFLENEICMVVHTANAFDWPALEAMIEALAAVKDKTGRKVHFITTSGAKIVSLFTGFDANRHLSDAGTDTIEYARSKSQGEAVTYPEKGLKVNIKTLDLCEALGVRSYLVFPPIVFGIRHGFGNRISIQEVAIVRSGRRLRQVYRATPKGDRWAICQVDDLADLYLCLVNTIISSDKDASIAAPPWGIKGGGGLYFAETGTVEWEDLYRIIATALHRRGLVSSPDVKEPSKEEQLALAKAIGLDDNTSLIAVQMGGNNPNLHGDNARKHLGWTPKYNEQHYLDVLSQEVDFILANDTQE